MNGYIYNGNSNGTLNISNSNINRNTTNGDITAFSNNGKTKIINSTISSNSTKGGVTALSNQGNAQLDNIDINIDISTNNNSATDYGIKNTGTISINNNSNINITLESVVRSHHTYGIHSTNNLTINDSNIIVTGNVYSNSHTNYGIYQESGSSTFSKGRITVNGRNTYGIYIKNGTFILGIPEPTTSINYGKDTAEVSTTSPLIESLGTNSGIGIKKENGTFKYYDGKILARHTALPEIPNEVEYLYEPKTFVDDDNHNYCILKWMREQNNGS